VVDIVGVLKSGVLRISSDYKQKRYQTDDAGS